jgi:hypothetical protein
MNCRSVLLDNTKSSPKFLGKLASKNYQKKIEGGNDSVNISREEEDQKSKTPV